MRAVAIYDDLMADPVVLPDEAPDMTVTQLHHAVVNRLFDVLCHLFGDRALVLAEIFVRVNETRQVSPDLLIAPGADPGPHTVYRVPAQPVPDVTVEVLSPANYVGEGRRQLDDKRELLGAIGVPLHIELDPDRGVLTTWHNVDGTLVADPPTDRYDGDCLGGLHLELVPGHVTMWMPDGREFTDADAEITRGDEATRRAIESARREAEATRREAEATQRADRLAEALRQAGIDPESV
jgi:hypothetical protein